MHLCEVLLLQDRPGRAFGDAGRPHVPWESALSSGRATGMEPTTTLSAIGSFDFTSSAMAWSMS